MLKRNIALTLSGQIWGLLLSTLCSVLLARGLGPEQRGLYALALWLPTTLATFAALGQGEVNSLFAGLHKDKLAALFTYSTVVSALMGAFGIILIWAYFFWLPIPLGKFGSLSRETTIVSSLLLPLLMAERLFAELTRGAQRIRETVLINGAAAFVQLAFTAALVYWLKLGLLSALAIMLLLRVTTVVLYLWVMRAFVKITPLAPEWGFIKQCLRYGMIFMFSSGAMFLINQALMFTLGYSKISERDLGLYAVAYMLAQQMQLVPTSVATAFLPQLSNNKKENLGHTPRVFRLTTIICFVVMLGLGGMSWLAVRILLGKEFIGSVPVIVAMLPGLAAFGPSRVLGSYLWVIGKPQYGLCYNWVVLAFLAGASPFFIQPLGIVGAGIANTVAYLLLSGFTVWAYLRESREGFRVLIPTAQDVEYLWHELLRICRKLPGVKRGSTSAQPQPSAEKLVP